LDLNKNELDKIVKEKVNKFQEIAKINNFPNMKSGRGKIWNVNYDISSLTSSINDNIKTSFLEILELWKNVLLKQEEGVHFNTKKEYKKRPNLKLVDRFLKDPTDENFKAFWDLLYASKQKSQSIHVLNNNEMSKIVSFIGKLRSNPKIDDKWLKQNKINNAYGTVLELHGLLNIETSPIINGCTKEALKVLGFKAKPDKYDIWLESFGEFKKVYEGEIGYVTNETNYKIPINYEIDKLFNVIDKVKLRDIEKAQSNEEKKLYQKVIKLKEQKLSSQIIEDKPKSDIQIPINTPANFILYGPPGTGKTYKTVDIATIIIGKNEKNIDDVDTIIIGGEKLNDEKIGKYDNNKWHDENIEPFKKGLSIGRIHFVTFHQNYSYEEFVGGLRPDTENEKELTFKWKPGIFIKACAKAMELARADGKEWDEKTDKTNKTLEDWFLNQCAKYSSDNFNFKDSKKVVLIIDEINRANISRVFGELITLIEDDKRIGGKHQLILTLPNGDKKFGVPANLIIMGTMNTADKSLELLDVALRRRFEFKGLFPKEKLVRKEFTNVFHKLNEKILVERKSPDLLIGHSYFMKDEETLEQIFNDKVIPLLNEYFMGNREKVKEFLSGIINTKFDGGVLKCDANKENKSTGDSKRQD